MTCGYPTAMHNGDEKAKLAYDIFIDGCKNTSVNTYSLEWCRCHHLYRIGENAVNVCSSLSMESAGLAAGRPEKNVFGVVGDISPMVPV